MVKIPGNLQIVFILHLAAIALYVSAAILLPLTLGGPAWPTLVLLAAAGVVGADAAVLLRATRHRALPMAQGSEGMFAFTCSWLLTVYDPGGEAAALQCTRHRGHEGQHNFDLGPVGEVLAVIADRTESTRPVATLGAIGGSPMVEKVIQELVARGYVTQRHSDGITNPDGEVEAAPDWDLGR